MKKFNYFFIIISLIISIYSCDDLLSTKSGNETLSLQLTFDSVLYTGNPNSIQKVISDRLQYYGIDAEQYSLKINKNQIELIVRNIANANDLIPLITSKGELEFWETYDCKEILNGIMVSNDEIPIKDLKKDQTKNLDNETSSVKSGEFNYEEVKQKSDVDSNRLFTYFRPNFIMNEKNQYEAGQGAVFGIAKIEDTAIINHYLEKDEVSRLFPRNLILKWGLKPPAYSNNMKILELFSIKAYRGEAVLNGSYLKSTEINNTKKGTTLSFVFNKEGAQILKKITQYNLNKSIAITIDNHVISSGTVIQIIENGKMELSGVNFTQNEFEIISALINGNKLPVSLKIIKQKISLNR